MTALSETIAAQGDLLEAVLTLDIDHAVHQIEPATRIWFVGTGTSQHAAELATWMFGPGERTISWSSSSAFAWTKHAFGKDDAVVVISHTAETAFAQRARHLALKAGARVVSITGPGRGWPEAVETVCNERSETYTASYLAALVVLARVSLRLRQSSFDEQQLSELPSRVRAAAIDPTSVLESPPERLLVLAGVGPGAVTAREGALKLREAARLTAEGYEAEYLLHGSAVPLRSGDVFLAIQPTQDEFGLLEGITAAAVREGLTARTVHEPEGLHPVLTQIPLTVRLQKLASDLADAQGLDPDHVICGGWVQDRLWRAGGP
jgi:glutamine---fructose-6-phosphate transaminase (isomerizing)